MGELEPGSMCLSVSECSVRLWEGVCDHMGQSVSEWVSDT